MYAYQCLCSIYNIPGDDHRLEPCTDHVLTTGQLYTAYNITRVTRRYSISKNTYRCDFVVQTVDEEGYYFFGRLLFVNEKTPYSGRCSSEASLEAMSQFLPEFKFFKIQNYIKF